MKCLICENQFKNLNLQNTENCSVLFCDSCNLHFVNYNEKKSIKGVKESYKEEFWQEWNLEDMFTSDFQTKTGQDYILAAESMYAFYKNFLHDNMKILEIGAGTGVHSILLDKMGFHVTSIEPNRESSILINNKLQNGICINGYFEDVHFDKKFDIILLYHVVEHIENPGQLLHKCKSLLNKNGKIIIAVPDCENTETLKQSISNKYHLWHFSKKSLEKLCEKLNYKIIKIDSFARLPTNQRRFHKILRKSKLQSLSKKSFPFYPLIPTTKKNGYEIRLVLSKNK